jgi:hypothetical protein
MSKRARVSVSARLWLGAAALWGATLAHAPAAAAGLITQTATLQPQTTDFSLQSPGSVHATPLVFQQFDDHAGALTLDSVDVKVDATIQNKFSVTFVTPATIFASAYSAFAADPSKTTPSLTIFAPDGKTPVLSMQVQYDPSKLSESVSYGGQAGQTLPKTFTSTPAPVTQSQTFHLTGPDALALFTGTNTLALPVTASAFSTFSSSSGNGQGSVSTMGSADVTVSYNYHDTIPVGQIVPEPTSLALWGLGGLTLAVRYRHRARARRGSA